MPIYAISLLTVPPAHALTFLNGMQEHDYATAWHCASVNRVDLALLVAYNWPDFLDHAAKLVRDVDHDQDLADILASLQPNDGTGGLLAALASPAVCPLVSLHSSHHCAGINTIAGIVAGYGALFLLKQNAAACATLRTAIFGPSWAAQLAGCMLQLYHACSTMNCVVVTAQTAAMWAYVKSLQLCS